jgi:hypothetical protein
VAITKSKALYYYYGQGEAEEHAASIARSHLRSSLLSARPVACACQCQ